MKVLQIGTLIFGAAVTGWCFASGMWPLVFLNIAVGIPNAVSLYLNMK